MQYEQDIELYVCDQARLQRLTLILLCRAIENIVTRSRLVRRGKVRVCRACVLTKKCNGVRWLNDS